MIKEAISQFLLGMGSVILAPAGLLPEPGLRITLPPNSVGEAVTHDFAQVSSDFARALKQREQASQLEFRY